MQVPRRAARYLAVTVLVGAALLAAFPPSVSVPVGSIERVEDGWAIAIEPPFRNVVLLQDGLPLPLRADLHGAEGAYHVSLGRFPPRIVFRPSHGGDPREERHRYAIRAPMTDKRRYRAGLLALALVGGVLIGAAHRPAADLWRRPAAQRLRGVAVALGVLPFCLLLLWTPFRSVVEVYPDTEGYVLFESYRTAGYPWFIALTSGAVDLPPSGSLPLVLGAATGLLGTVWAQKLLWLAALAFFGTCLSARLSALGTALILAPLAAFTADATHLFFWNAALSDPLSHAAALVAAGFAFVFAARPGAAVGVGVGVAVAAAIVVRPANQIMLLLFPFLALIGDPPRELWRRARRLAPGAAVAALLLLAYMSWNHVRIGYFGVAPFMTQGALLGNALEVARPADAAALSDPDLREFVAECLREGAARGVSHRTSENYLNQWVYEIAGPRLPDLVRLKGNPALPWNVNVERLTAGIARQLIGLNFGDYVRLVLWNVTRIEHGFLASPWVLGLLAVYAAALTAGPRLGTDHRGFVAVTVVLFLAAVLLYSALNVPIRRYTEFWHLLLWVGIAVHALDLLHRLLTGDRTRISTEVPTVPRPK